MSAPVLSVHDLSKTFRVPQREPGLRSAMRSIFHRTYTQVPAVRNISFDLAPGEIIGLIGQNGAGKTSTLKLLSGLLHPTSGSALVAGFIPWQRKPAFLRSISMVLGNKSQLIWDIPPLDSFRVLGEIYNIPSAEFKRRVDELVAMLEMQDLLTRPVRNLSLGERMKCELAAGLLHRPQVLFLDEPTLGLDVSIQLRLRAFIAEYNHRFGATVILTSHYMADVAALCPRVVLMHEGRILYDGALNGLAERIAPYKLIRVGIASGSLPANLADVLPRGAELIEQDADHLSLRVPRDSAAGITAALLEKLPVADLSVEDPPIEAVIDRIYQEGL